MPILFGNNNRNQSKNLLEFKAGKMFMKGNTVHPDKRKGLIYIHQSDDSLMHFCWKDRTGSTVEDDLIIFPDDVEYKRITQCTTGRVYVLKFKSTNRKCFFWMQEPKIEKDDEFCQKVNEYLNNPPALGSSRSGGSTPGEGDLQNILSSMNQQQFMQLLGGMSGVSGMGNLSSLLGSHGANLQSSITSQSSTRSASASSAKPDSSSVATTVATTAASSTATVTSAAAAAPAATVTAPAVTDSRNNQIQIGDLRNILSGLNVPPTVADTDEDGAAGSRPADIDISNAFTAETLQPLLNNPEFISSLQSYLPPTEEGSSVATVDQLRGTVQSPQFAQAMSMFSAALHSGQLGPLMQQFGLGEEVVNAAAQGDVEAFVKALQASQKQSSEKDKGAVKQEKEDDDEDMALD